MGYLFLHRERPLLCTKALSTMEPLFCCFSRKVITMHRSGKAANEPAIEVVQAVGYVKIDLDTPTPVLREFIRRFCGGWLNEHAKVWYDSALQQCAMNTGTLSRCES